MTRYKNQRELDEMMEDEFNETDKKVTEPDTSKDKEVDWKKRYSDLRRMQSEQEANYKQRISQAERQIEGFKNGTLRPPKTEDEIEEWKTQYPEFSDVLESWMSRLVEDKTQDLKKQSIEIKREKALLDLRKKHPDAEAIFADQDFHTWLAEQSEAEKNYIYKSFDVKNASFVLDKYKFENNKVTKAEVDDAFDPRDAAKSVRTRSETKVNSDSDGYLFSESQIEEMDKKDPRWWDANEDKILDAQRRGKILMDITGGAR